MEMDSLFSFDDYDLTSTPGLWQCLLDMSQIIRSQAQRIASDRRRRFGPSSEKAAYGGRTLFDADESLRKWYEAEDCAPADQVPEPPEEPVLEVRAHTRRPRTKRQDQIPDSLPVETVEHNLSEEELICPECGRRRVIIGTEATEQVVVIPAHMVRRRHLRQTCSCPHCNKTGESAHVEKAPMPQQPIPGSFAAPETLAWVMDQKYNLGLPLYRIEQALAVQGIRISRQTLSGWMTASADLLRPVVDALHDRLIAGDIIMTDDTPLQVLREPGKSAQSKSYQWVYRTDPFAPMQIILYDYQPRHTMDGVKDYLQGFSGWLQGDGFKGYDQLPENIHMVACLAHVRRKFREALVDLPEQARAGTLAQQGLRWCQALYTIEREIRGRSPADRQAVRLEKAAPILDDFETWLNEEARYVGKTKTGKAIRYALGQFPHLRRYLEDGRLAIDNNLTESGGIKPFVMGRKAWLFSNTPRGAEASAILYSLVQTARANGLAPVQYLTMLLAGIPNVLDRSDPDWIVPFLPVNQNPPSETTDAN